MFKTLTDEEKFNVRMAKEKLTMEVANLRQWYGAEITEKVLHEVAHEYTARRVEDIVNAGRKNKQ